MSKIHVLKSDNNFSYTIAIHFATPAGNNTIGQTWKACAISNGDIGTTSLKVGNNPGNITQIEYDSIIAGDTVEIIETISPGLNPTNAAVESLADICINEYQTKMSRVLKYFGYKIEGV